MLWTRRWWRREAGKRAAGTAVCATTVSIVAAGMAMLVLHWAALSAQWTPHTVFLANLGVIFLTAAALAVATRRECALVPNPLPQWEILAVVGLTAVGAYMRAACWEVFPPADGQLLEEPQVAWNAVRSIRAGHLDVYFPIVNLIGEVGFRALGPTMNGLRIPFVVLGVLSVPIFHLVARSFLRSPRAALFVTSLFATNSMLAGSSRIALETMHPIFTTVVAMTMVVYAGQRPTIGNCALAGACNGLLFTEYDSYRLVPVLNFIFLAMRLAIRSRDASRPSLDTRRTASVVCLLVFGAFAVGVELARHLIYMPRPLEYLDEAIRRHDSYLHVHRAEMTWGQIVAEELDKLRTNLQFLFLQGEHADVLPPTMGHFDPYTGVIGAIALGFCLLRAWWNPLRLFPVVAIVVLTVLSSVLVGTPARYRLLPAIPYYLLSIGLLVDAIDSKLPHIRRWISLALVAISTCIALVNAQRFFGVAIWDRQVQEMFYDLSMVLSHEIAEVQRNDPTAPVIVLSDQVHLAVPNDYAFWYNYETVKVLPSPEAARGRIGYLLAHDQFIPKPDDLPGMRDCEQWKTKFDRNVILRCRLAEEKENEPTDAGQPDPRSVP